MKVPVYTKLVLHAENCNIKELYIDVVRKEWPRNPMQKGSKERVRAANTIQYKQRKGRR